MNTKNNQEIICHDRGCQDGECNCPASADLNYAATPAAAGATREVQEAQEASKRLLVNYEQLMNVLDEHFMWATVQAERSDTSAGWLALKSANLDQLLQQVNIVIATPPAPAAAEVAQDADPVEFFWSDCLPDEYAAILNAYEPLRQKHKWPMEKAYKQILSRLKQELVAARATTPPATGAAEAAPDTFLQSHIAEGKVVLEEHGDAKGEAYVKWSKAPIEAPDFAYVENEGRRVRITTVIELLPAPPATPAAQEA